jgi:hypothetical protein
VEYGKQIGWEEGTALHLRGQRGTDTLEGVPPGYMSVQPVGCGEMGEGLGGVPRIRVDIGKTGEPGRLWSGQIGVKYEGVRRHQVEEGRTVCEGHGDSDSQQRYGM